MDAYMKPLLHAEIDSAAWVNEYPEFLMLFENPMSIAFIVKLLRWFKSISELWWGHTNSSHRSVEGHYIYTLDEVCTYSYKVEIKLEKELGELLHIVLML